MHLALNGRNVVKLKKICLCVSFVWSYIYQIDNSVYAGEITSCCCCPLVIMDEYENKAASADKKQKEYEKRCPCTFHFKRDSPPHQRIRRSRAIRSPIHPYILPRTPTTSSSNPVLAIQLLLIPRWTRKKILSVPSSCISSTHYTHPVKLSVLLQG